MGKTIGCICPVLLSLLLLVSNGLAQGVGASGNIRGTVTDSSGAVLPDANISVTDPRTGLERTLTSDASGGFHILGLPPASYEMTVQKAGFAKEIRRGVVVAVGQTVFTDFKLRLSQVSVE